MGPDGLADDYLTSNLGWLMALRGDAATAGTLLADLRDLRASEDLQDKSLISVVEAFTAAVAITGLREHSTPYHLAHGLLDHAEYLTRQGDAEAAALTIEEARTIGNSLRCRPLLDRADTMEDARTRIRA